MLKRANLQGANLEGANLEGANLRGARLNGTNLKGTKLREASVLLGGVPSVIYDEFTVWDISTGGPMSSMENVFKKIDLDKESVRLMMVCQADRIDAKLYHDLSRLEDDYNILLEKVGPNDPFVKQSSILYKLADLLHWKGNVLRKDRRFEEAVNAFETAAQQFDQLGESDSAQRSRNKAAALQLEMSEDIDNEFDRLDDLLKSAEPGSLDFINLLITQGELYSRANDDSSSVEKLNVAEEALEALGGYPSDEELAENLIESIEQIENGDVIVDSSPIMRGIKRRALTRRLWLGMGKAYRTTDPDKALEYEEKFKSTDDDKDFDPRELLGQLLDAGQDITAFLNKLKPR